LTSSVTIVRMKSIDSVVPLVLTVENPRHPAR
jgi:hypothetical protein